MERIPILEMGLFPVTIQVDMHDRHGGDATGRPHGARRRLRRPSGVLIDISGPRNGGFLHRPWLKSIAAMSRILDAYTVLVGMQPSVHHRWNWGFR